MHVPDEDFAGRGHREAGVYLRILWAREAKEKTWSGAAGPGAVPWWGAGPGGLGGSVGDAGTPGYASGVEFPGPSASFVSGSGASLKRPSLALSPRRQSMGR